MDTNQSPPPPPAKPGKSTESIVARSIAFAAALAIVLAIAFPSGCPWDLTFADTNSLRAKQQVLGITNAIRLFETQYGALPPSTAGTADIPTDARLIDILTGSDRTHNPKGITFIEGRIAKAPRGHRPLRDGFIDHGNGSSSLVDPWGNHYLVRLDDDGDGWILPPGSTKPIRASAICWSPGPPTDKDNHLSALHNPPKEFICSWK